MLARFIQILLIPPKKLLPTVLKEENEEALILETLSPVHILLQTNIKVDYGARIENCTILS